MVSNRCVEREGPRERRKGAPSHHHASGKRRDHMRSIRGRVSFDLSKRLGGPSFLEEHARCSPQGEQARLAWRTRPLRLERRMPRDRSA
jgi:hypothetical protein